jgi:hypothetical protein
MWLRRFWLQRALRDYPVYDPPHKREERLLTKELARENFDYFMEVRQQRAEYFRDWLRRFFRVILTPDAKGIEALSRWGNKYVGLLLDTDSAGNPTDSYFTYSPSWTGNNAGCNVVFDMGITFGEFIILNCPKLYWDVDPTSSILPRTTKARKRSPGMSFQRPVLTGSENPTWIGSPLHDVHGFAHQMIYLANYPDACRYYRSHKEDRRLVRDELLNNFNSTLNYYPDFDPYQLRHSMSKSAYQNLVDRQT